MVACLFWIGVFSPGKYASTLLLKCCSTKPDFNVYMKFMCRSAALFSDILIFSYI